MQLRFVMERINFEFVIIRLEFVEILSVNVTPGLVNTTLIVFPIYHGKPQRFLTSSKNFLRNRLKSNQSS